MSAFSRDYAEIPENAILVACDFSPNKIFIFAIKKLGAVKRDNVVEIIVSYYSYLPTAWEFLGFDGQNLREDCF